MNDALFVGHLEPHGGFTDQLDGLRHADLMLQDVANRLATLDQTHDGERATVVFTHVVDGANIRVCDLGYRANLTREPLSNSR